MVICAIPSEAMNLRNRFFETRGLRHRVSGNTVRFLNSLEEVTGGRGLVAVNLSHTPAAVNISHPLAESQSAVYQTKEVNAEGADGIVGKAFKNLQSENELKTDIGGLGGDIFDGNGKFPGGGGGDEGGGGSGAGEGEEQEDEEFGPIMKFEEVIKETEARGGSGGLLGFEMKSCSVLRNRMLADPSFLFKVGTEIVIDTCCATFAEIQKWGKNLWAVFELFAADLLVAALVNAALVGMLAPWAFIGQPSASKGCRGRLQNSNEALLISVFEAERPGCRFSIKLGIANHSRMDVLYGSICLACGIIGQGIANLIWTGKGSIRNPEDEMPEKPPVKTAARSDVSSLSQIRNGQESFVEASPPPTQVPLTAVVLLLMLLLLIAMASKISVRSTNNTYGGMQFVD